MRVALLLFMLCVGLVVYALQVDGLLLTDVVVFSLALCGISLVILGLAVLRRAKAVRTKRLTPDTWVLVDGSNVMHWNDNQPQLATVRGVVRALTERGYNPGVVFDANAGYKLMGRFTGEHEFARLLGLPQDQIFVVPKGTQADPYLLDFAQELKACIVTNDRFRDWADAHPEVHEPGHLIRGGFRDGNLWLDDRAKTPS